MERYGNYQVVQKIGEGRRGVTFRGLDVTNQAPVVIKTLRATTPEAQERFLEGAEIAASLEHRNIARVYFFGVEEGVPFLVQEFLSGEELEHKIQRREFLPLASKLLYLIQVARGLDYAHTRGVVHRDVRPGNIRVLEDEGVKILDFGSARLARAEAGVHPIGETLTTAAYQSPEQIRGEAADHRGDIFSYGLLAYELLSFQRPFRGSNPSAVLYQILTEEAIPITTPWPDCPEGLRTIVHRCLAKSPQDRYQECGELLADLNELLKSRRGRALAEETEPPPSASEGGGEAHVVSPPPPPSPSPLPPPSPSPPPPPSPSPPPGNSGEAIAGADPRFSTLTSASPHQTMQVPAGGIDGVDLQPLREAKPPANPLAMPRPNPPAKKRSGGLWFLVIVLLAAGGGAGYLWLWPELAPRWTAQAPDDGSVTSPAGAGGGRESPAPRDDAKAVADPGTTAGGASDPTTAKLVLPRAWDPEMTVSINGGRALVLDRETTLDLAPGSYEFSFDLVTHDYQAAAQGVMDLRSGETRTLPVAIPRPGRLTVRNLSGSPPGWITCGGEILGRSPLEARRFPPGQHRLVISPGPREDAPTNLQQEITLRSDYELVVTFDLRFGQPPQIQEQPFDDS